MPKISKIPFTFSRPRTDAFGIFAISPIYQDLKIKSVPKVLIYPESEILIESQSKKISDYTFFDYYNDFFQDTFITKEKTPYLICFCDGYFTNLDNIIYETPVRDYLNKVGLHIYFWEMIVLKTSNTSLGQWPMKYSEESQIAELYNNNKDTIVGFESTETTLSTLSCFDFDCITKFVRQNRLTNVTIFTGNYQNHKYFSKNYPEIKFKVRDLATASMFNYTSNKSFTAYTYNPDLTPPTAETIEYKFWCSNRRYSGMRNIVAAYLVSRSALVSFDYYYTDFLYEHSKIPPSIKFWNNINNKLWFDIHNWKTTHQKIYNTLKPGIDYIDTVKYLSIDKDMLPGNDFMHDIVPAEQYHRCFCAIVTESEFAQPCGHYADKTLNAIKCFRPFVLAASPHSLEYLKTCGVKTFDQWWDESYDQEENHELRLIKILELIDYIDSIPLDELKEMYNQMLPTLEHNYKVIQNLKYQMQTI